MRRRLARSSASDSRERASSRGQPPPDPARAGATTIQVDTAPVSSQMAGAGRPRLRSAPSPAAGVACAASAARRGPPPRVATRADRRLSRAGAESGIRREPGPVPSALSIASEPPGPPPCPRVLGARSPSLAGRPPTPSSRTSTATSASSTMDPTQASGGARRAWRRCGRRLSETMKYAAASTSRAAAPPGGRRIDTGTLALEARSSSAAPRPRFLWRIAGWRPRARSRSSSSARRASSPGLADQVAVPSSPVSAARCSAIRSVSASAPAAVERRRGGHARAGDAPRRRPRSPELASRAARSPGRSARVLA